METLLWIAVGRITAQDIPITVNMLIVCDKKDFVDVIKVTGHRTTWAIKSTELSWSGGRRDVAEEIRESPSMKRILRARLAGSEI